MSKREPEEPADDKPSIDERIAQLREINTSNAEIVRILYSEEYSTHDIMKRGLPLKALKKSAKDDKTLQSSVAGSSKGPGYVDEFKLLIKKQVSRNRELMEIFSDMGMGVLLAGLRKSGITMDEFQKIALGGGEGLREALTEAGKTAFKALEYFESELFNKVEDERDEARAYATLLKGKVENLMKSLDPKFRLEKMIQTYLFSGTVDPDILDKLIDKWLSLEVAEVMELT